MRNQSGTFTQTANEFGSIERSPELVDVIAEIERRIGLLQSAEQELPNEEEISREREENLRGLAEQQNRVEERRREQDELIRQMSDQQAEIERLQAELQRKQEELSSRESSVAGRAQQLEQMEASLAQAKAELARQQKEAKRLAEAQEREQRRLAEYKVFLAQREQELELQAEQQRKMRRELTELAAKLAEAEKQTKADALKSDEERKAAEKRIRELEERCSSLEESCRILKKRRERSAESVAVPASAPAGPMAAPMRVGPAAATTVAPWAGLIVLLSTVAALGVAGAIWMLTHHASSALWATGASFLVPLFACAAIKRRGVDLGLMLVAVFAGMLGFWFEPWLGVVASALELWRLPLELVPTVVVPQLPLASAVLTATLALSIATGLACDDFEVLFRGILVSVATGAILLLPSSGIGSVAASVAVWVLLHTLMLIKWATPAGSAMVPAARGTGRLMF